MTEGEIREANPYIAPPAERHCPTLTNAERNCLIEILEFREPTAGNGTLARGITRSLCCTPIAIVFAGLFAAGTYALVGIWPVAVYAAAVAFLAVMGGFLLRDFADSTNTRTLRDLLCSITDFAEAERLLYGGPVTSNDRRDADEPLAAIPVEDECPAGSMVDAKR